MTSKNTPIDLSARVAANARTLRKMRGWTAQELADRMTAAGCPISRAVIAKRETTQVPSRISVDELFAFAAVFGQAVTDLVAEEIACKRCAGSPPAGFTCNGCGANAEQMTVERVEARDEQED